MDREFTCSGYCRALDQSRLVIAEFWDGSWEADCGWPDCPYAPGCPIGQQLSSLEHTEI